MRFAELTIPRFFDRSKVSRLFFCIVVGFLSPHNRLTLYDLYDAFRLGAKYALAVGASAATVGIIVGVVSLTGMGFKISFMVTKLYGGYIMIEVTFILKRLLVL